MDDFTISGIMNEIVEYTLNIIVKFGVFRARLWSNYIMRMFKNRSQHWSVLFQKSPEAIQTEGKRIVLMAENCFRQTPIQKGEYKRNFLLLQPAPRDPDSFIFNIEMKAFTKEEPDPKRTKGNGYYFDTRGSTGHYSRSRDYKTYGGRD